MRGISRRRLVPVLALVAAGCGGGDGSPAGGGDTRTVEVRMVDVAFEPARLEVRRGETVRFVFRNAGSVRHEAYAGDAAAQAEHAKEMASGDGHGGHGGHGGDGASVTVAPGATGELTYTFDRAGTVEIGCHEPGHYDAGMKLVVAVR